MHWLHLYLEEQLWLPVWMEEFRAELVTAGVLTVRLVLALALGCVVGGIYRLTHHRQSAQLGSFVATLVLLTVLISMVTTVIGDSVARAFSLVGALAIVRFRTVVEDTRDTAFVIFAVVVGMAVGADSIRVPLLGIPLVALAAWTFRPREIHALREMGRLIIRIGMGRPTQAALDEVFTKHFQTWDLIGTTTARQGAALDLTYRVQLRKGVSALPLITELNQLEGMQGVEWKQGED